jgi:hypothetical protein
MQSEAKKMTTRTQPQSSISEPAAKECRTQAQAVVATQAEAPTQAEVPTQTEVMPAETPGQHAENYVRSRKQAAWHVIVVTFFTLTLYVPFWIYKTCALLKKYARQTKASSTTGQAQQCFSHDDALTKYANARPWLSALLSIVPVINCFVIANLFRDIATAIPNSENFARKNPTFAGLTLTLAMACLWMLGKQDGPAFLLFTLVGVPVAIAQGWLNLYWDRLEHHEHPDQSMVVRGSFSPLEIIAIVVGGMAVALVVVGFSVSTP